MKIIRNSMTGCTIALLAMLLGSCVKDDAGCPVPADGETTARVPLRLEVPAVALPATRAITGQNEQTVKQVDILAFNSADVLVYRVHIDQSDISPDGDGGYKIVPELVKSNDQTTFVILANASQSLDVVNDGITYGQLQGLLVKQSDRWNAASPQDYDPIPMWAETSFQVYKGVEAPGVRLIRMLSRINVYSHDPDFELQQVLLYNPMDKGYIIPDKSRWDSDKNCVDSESIAEEWNCKDTPIVYDNIANPNPGEYQVVNEIYTFEAPKKNLDDPSKATFLLIAGSYKGGPTTYFRLDFAAAITDADGKTEGYDFLPLLRNHSYEFNILRVEGAGYPTTEDAIQSTPSNTTQADIEMIVENDYRYNFHIYDDTHYLALETKEFYYDWWEDEFQMDFLVKTNFPTGWKAVIESPDNTPWLRLGADGTSITQTGEAYNKTVFIRLRRQDISNLTDGVITISAGRLQATLDVRASAASAFAKSNIVMVENRLTFATNRKENESYPANWRGVFFRFASLVASSGDQTNAAQNEGSLSSIVFYPSEMTIPANWSSIPYYETNSLEEDVFGSVWPNIRYDEQRGLGDICTYISDKGWVEGRWRTPTQKENLALWNSRVRNSIGEWIPSTNVNEPDSWGTAPLLTGQFIGTESSTNYSSPPDHTLFVPASGYINRYTGLLHSSQNTGYYWSATTSEEEDGETRSKSIQLTSGGAYELDGDQRTGYTIRCIRDI